MLVLQLNPRDPRRQQDLSAGGGHPELILHNPRRLLAVAGVLPKWVQCRIQIHSFLAKYVYQTCINHSMFGQLDDSTDGVAIPTLFLETFSER